MGAEDWARRGLKEVGGARCLYLPSEPSHKEVLWRDGYHPALQHLTAAKGCQAEGSVSTKASSPPGSPEGSWQVQVWGLHPGSTSSQPPGSGTRTALGGRKGGTGRVVLLAQRSPGCLPPRGSRTTAPTSNAGPPAPAPPGRSASAVTPRPRGRPSTIAVQVLAPAPTAPFTPLNLCFLLL